MTVSYTEVSVSESLATMVHQLTPPCQHIERVDAASSEELNLWFEGKCDLVKACPPKKLALR